MGIYENTPVDFARRTLKIIEQYDKVKQKGKDNFEVTLLINCLVGLLVLPYEHQKALIPEVSAEHFSKWNIEALFVKSWGNSREKSLRGLIKSLRNCVAHFRIEAEGNSSNISGLKFSDKNGFRAIIPVENLKAFVIKLATAMSSNAA